MRIKSQDEILDPAVRKKIIEEIEGPENKERKYKHFRRHMIMKDQTDYFVIDMLQKQLDQATVKEMTFALSNISIYRKVIDKLARVYNAGVDRKVMKADGTEDVESTKKIEELASELEVNTKQKTLNRYLKAHLNTCMYIKPCPNEDGSWSIVLMPMAPHLYDVVEHYYDRTKPMVYVLSNYDYKQVSYTNNDPSKEGRSFTDSVIPRIGDQKDQVIADTPEDANYDSKEYIWWSDKYHFTTDCTGEIKSESNENPIEVKPFVDYGINRDNQFWVTGGDDLVESHVRINAQISHINFIGQLQGYGQFYYSGKNPPKNMALGPNKGIVLIQEEGDPVPNIGYASANPQLASLQAQVEMQVALMLTTNNLSTSGVATTLANNQSAASGISLIIDKSESMEDVQEQQQLFIDNEPEMWEIINKWLELYGSDATLDEDLQDLAIPDDQEVVTTFKQPQVIMTDKEKLEAIQLRKDLGLNSMSELIQMDRPGVTDDQAKEIETAISKEKIERMAKFGTNPADPNATANGVDVNGSQKDNGQQIKDGVGAGPIQ